MGVFSPWCLWYSQFSSPTNLFSSYSLYFLDAALSLRPFYVSQYTRRCEVDVVEV